jgi:long-chain acyl-CoA synthetase
MQLIESSPDHIQIQESTTLSEIFRQRVRRTPEKTAYVHYDHSSDKWIEHSWQETAEQVSLWQWAIRAEGFDKGDRIAIMCRNRWEWIICDQAVMGLGLVLVPLYTNDRPDNASWIIEHVGARMLVVETYEQWESLSGNHERLGSLERVVSIQAAPDNDDRLRSASNWLPNAIQELAKEECPANKLITIVYTSGTTGRPKGVMLSHENIAQNVKYGLEMIEVKPEYSFLSFLPLSHTLERTVGYYLPMVTGSKITFNRSIPELAEDLEYIGPSVLISVPRIFERIYTKIYTSLESASPVKRVLFNSAVDVGWRKFEHVQGRANWTPRLLLHPMLDALVGKKIRDKLGGELKFTVCGGAALSPEVARLFIGLGIPILQGYGLTETSPIITVNPLQSNQPDSVGIPLPNVEIKTTDEGELITRSPCVMLGYWRNPEATAEVIDKGNWFHTGDKVNISTSRHVRITGRLKEIIVLSNGEKVPPGDIENAIALSGIIDQAALIGEGRSYLTALIVPNTKALKSIALEKNWPANIEELCEKKEMVELFQEAVKSELASFPGYANIYKIILVAESWTPDNGLLTPTLKLRRNKIIDLYADEVEALYADH